MRDPKAIQLLIVEDCLEDEQFLRDAIDEMVEAPHWPNWHTCELIPADSVCDAVDYLQRQRFDAILLNLTLPDGDTLLGTFERIRAAAGLVPIIVLADEEDENLAHTLLREGAQDVIVKSDLECVTLARSLRYAIERQRHAKAVEAMSFLDELTGLYNERGFAAFAGHDMQLARRTGNPLLIAMVEVSAPAPVEDHDLVLVRTAERLRSCMGEATVLARLGDRHFGISTITMSENGLDRTLQSMERQMRVPVHVRVGCATYGSGYEGELWDLLKEAESRMAPKVAMLAH